MYIFILYETDDKSVNSICAQIMKKHCAHCNHNIIGRNILMIA